MTMFNRDTAGAHLDLVVGNEAGHVALAFGLRPYRDNGRYRHAEFVPSYFRWPAERTQLLNEIGRTLATGELGDVYLCPTVRGTASRSTHDPGVRGRYAWLDLDGSPVPDELLELGAGVIDSGTDGHFHVYIPLGEWVEDKELGDINRGLARQYGGDAKWATNSLLRLAGTVNCKPATDTDPGLPAPVEFRVAPVPDKADLAAVRLLAGATVAPSQTGTAPRAVDTSALPEPVRRALENTQPADRSTAHFALAGACLRSGLSVDQTRAIARGYGPSVEKYGHRVDEETDRALLRLAVDERPRTRPTESDKQDRPWVQISTGPDTIRVLKSEIDAGLLPDTYVSDGRIVHMEQVSGGLAAAAVDEDAPLPMSASVVTAPSMAGLLAEHAFVYRIKYRKQPDGSMEPYEEETTPAAAALSAVLAAKTWPRVPPLVGIIGAPVLRRDGTLLQDSGYDRATGLYLARKVPLERIPDAPTSEQVKAAKDFLLERFLVDFPWKDKADRANYLGLLVTPILRPYTRCLTPFGVIDATMPGSGKTILTGGPGMLYGQRVLPWPYAEEELRKSITAVMRESVGVCVFDNLAEGTVIDSAVLAQLITSPTWSDRELGSSRTLAAANNLLWLATGNNLRVGGDMATRSVLVRLDPDMPHPEYRTGFSIPNLDSWITYPANQRTVLQHVLVLAVDWTRANAPRHTGLTMRQFTPWAQAVGGLLAHHGIPGFLDNAADVRTIDEDESRWLAFLSHWRTRHGTRRLTASDLRRDGEPQYEFGREHDEWDGVFITTKSGRLPHAVGLGRMLAGQVSRWRGDYVLRSALNDRGDRAEFWVEKAGDAE